MSSIELISFLWYKADMEYAYIERIGKPELFTGRTNELAFFLNWINGIKQEKSQSTALLARRKMGKTALMERLFNITFYKDDIIIPFYYEVREVKMWMGDFCKDFFLTFIYQYIAFKTRNKDYLDPLGGYAFSKAVEIAEKEGLSYLAELIKGVEIEYSQEHIDTLWTMVRDAPRRLAARQNEYILQMIDEFQFMNAKIYRDKNLDTLQNDMAAGYLGTAESKIAPLLVSGSWVGWLMNDLMTMLPSRFKYEYLHNMPEQEAVEMIYKFAHFFDTPVTEESVYLLAHMAEGSPFYISSIIRSSYREKDLTTLKGLTDVMEFETLDNRGAIKFTWMEYIASAFPQINDRNAKNIVLYLCKHRDREVTRAELLRELKLDMTDGELEKRLNALIRADIISQGQTNYDYQGVQDNIFDKVFRGVYEKEIRQFDVSVIKKEFNKKLETLQNQYRRLQGKFNYQKGYFAEYVILDQLVYNGVKKNEGLKSITQNLPGDFDFCEYENAWTYRSAIVHNKGFSVDILARAKVVGHYSIIGEVKNRETKKFSLEEAKSFREKFLYIKEKEHLEPVIGLVFSRKGFTKDAETFLKRNAIAFTDNEEWLTV